MPGIVAEQTVGVMESGTDEYPILAQEIGELLAILTHLPLSGPQGKHDLSRNHINVALRAWPTRPR